MYNRASHASTATDPSIRSPTLPHCQFAENETETALYRASHCSRDKNVTILLNHGADPRIGKKDDVREGLARHKQHCFLTPSPLTQTNRKPLHAAAHWGKKRCVALLLLADDSVIPLKDNAGRDVLGNCRDSSLSAAVNKWVAGDKEAALRGLGAEDLIPQLGTSSDSDLCFKLWKAASDKKLAETAVLAAQAHRRGVIDRVGRQQSPAQCCNDVPSALLHSSHLLFTCGVTNSIRMARMRQPFTPAPTVAVTRVSPSF